MINNDLLMDLILKMNALRMKKGQDVGLKRKVVDAVNAFIGEKSLDTIYINTESNTLIPDVFVMPVYNDKFGSFLLDSELGTNCPYGYTIEIKTDAFDNYSAEELTAVVIHHILQNVQSACSRVRFLTAYTNAINKYNDNDVLDMFRDISHPEICYFAYIDICSRPFNVPVSYDDYVGTDDVLKNVGLADAFDSYLIKTNGISNKTPEDVIEWEIKRDFKTLETIMESIMNRDILCYYEMIRNALPLVTLKYITGKPDKNNILGFVSYNKSFAKKYPTKISSADEISLTESIMNPQNEIELRFQIDKIITEMKYLETEAERAAILFRIKQLHLKLIHTEMKLSGRLQKHPGNRTEMEKLKYVEKCISELDSLRKKVVEKPVTPKHYGVFVQYPAGYEY